MMYSPPPPHLPSLLRPLPHTRRHPPPAPQPVLSHTAKPPLLYIQASSQSTRQALLSSLCLAPSAQPVAAVPNSFHLPQSPNRIPPTSLLLSRQPPTSSVAGNDCPSTAPTATLLPACPSPSCG